MAVPMIGELNELYKGADSGALACMVAKLAVEKSLTSRLDETRQALQARLMAALKEFRLLHGASVRTPNRLIFPDTLKYLPLWTLGILKSAALRCEGMR